MANKKSTGTGTGTGTGTVQFYYRYNDKKNNSLSNVDEDLYCFFLCSHASFLFTMHCYGLSCTSVDCLGLPWRLRVIVLILHAWPWIWRDAFDQFSDMCCIVMQCYGSL